MGEKTSQIGKPPKYVLALDTETTIHNTGNPFDIRNFLVAISWASSTSCGALRVLDDPEASRKAIQDLVDGAGLIIGFNFKFDLHWLLKFGITINCPIWDCQNTEFVLTRQTMRYPSLDGCCEKYGLGQKIDVIDKEYWSKGINTDAIPWPILQEYATLDAVLTYHLYEAQLPYLTTRQTQLLKVLNQDLLVLQEMEAHGLIYDEDLCKERSNGLESRMNEIRAELDSIYPDIPINWASGDHVSAFLYGGTITETQKEFIGLFKSGKKMGEPRYQNVEVNHTLPRLYEPLKGSELKKEGYWATNADTLLKLKGKQGPLKLMLELAKLEKLNGTYYKGIPGRNAEMHWEPNTLHGSFNMVVAQTGRLSSSDPNLQNMASDIQDILVSRYE